jgi:hypothetical protein
MSTHRTLSLRQVGTINIVAVKSCMGRAIADGHQFKAIWALG